MNIKDLPKTSKEATLLKLSYYFTGVECKNGHVALRQTSNHYCVECRNINITQVAIQFTNPPNTPRELNGDAGKHASNRFRKNNPLGMKEIELRKYAKRVKNGDIARWGASRRAAKLNATVGWSNRDKIQRIYEQCRILNDTTDEEYEVDHIIPLQSKLVCGLHCEDNLRIITAHANRVKHNNF